MEKEQRKKAEREAVEQRKIDDEMREVKLSFLHVCVKLKLTVGIFVVLKLRCGFFLLSLSLCVCVCACVCAGKETAKEAQLPPHPDRVVRPLHGQET